jgi:hypothetical protein
MSAQLKLFAVVVMLGLSSVGHRKPPAPEYSITISLRDSTVKVRSFVLLNIAVKNITKRDITVGAIVGSSESGYDIDIADEEGNAPAETSYGRKIRGKEPRDGLLDTHSEMAVNLKPGEATQELIYLNRIFDFTHPGKYIVQLSQTVYANDAAVKAGVKTIIKSNSVTLTVTN